MSYAPQQGYYNGQPAYSPQTGFAPPPGQYAPNPGMQPQPQIIVVQQQDSRPSAAAQAGCFGLGVGLCCCLECCCCDELCC
ncbi:hypothetical protein Q8F55_000755 [Vanrija albida]|uniref:Cysteine-rich transmembrane CYSTM domain-containing protein n=1 Tax=Vanrija albida TaxID=181172 RepID=A0ABR3QE61_9TREE